MGIGLRRVVLPIVFSVFLIGGLMASQAAAAITLTFDDIGLVHGQEVTNQYAAQGVTISVTNPGEGPDQGIIFDSDMFVPSADDADLTGPPQCNNWADSNFNVQQALGNILIIAENATDFATNAADTGSCTENEPDYAGGVPDTIIDDVDDEAGAHGQKITLTFQPPICEIGLDLRDIDQGGEVANGMFASFQMAMPMAQTDIGFSEFEAGGTFDVGAMFGDHTFNRIAPLTVAQLGLLEIDEVVITFGGSGAIDNVVFEPCEFVGGHGGPVDKTALMVTGAQLNASWMIPVLISAIGIGVFVVTRK